jgi:hypothetical protein
MPLTEFGIFPAFIRLEKELERTSETSISVSKLKSTACGGVHIRRQKRTLEA